jgi:hypothetical protein
MGRQVFYFILICAVWAFLNRDIQTEFLDIWFQMKADGLVTNSDYQATWGRFILPRIALFSLTLLPVIAVLSFDTKKRSAKRRNFISRVWHAY